MGKFTGYAYCRNYIDLIDFNEISIELGLDDTTLTDPGHCTMEGANIVTHYLADYIEDNYSYILENRTFDTVDESNALYSDYLNLYSEFLNIKEQLLDDYEGTN